MAGSKLGGLKTARTNKEKYGEDFYRSIGAIGGKRGRTGGFASNKVGKDGLTGRQRALIAGAKGGKTSRRGPSQKKVIKTVELSNRDEAGETHGMVGLPSKLRRIFHW